MPHRCAFGCKPDGTALHQFPNPDKFPQRFQIWVNFVEGKEKSETNSFSDFELYKKKRLCDNHFSNEYKNRFKRLNILAVPTILLPDESKLIDNSTDSNPDIVTLHYFNNDDCNQSETTVTLAAESGLIYGSPIIRTTPLNTNVEVGVVNNDNITLRKPAANVIKEHNYSATCRTEQNNHKNGSNKDYNAFDRDAKTEIFRNLFNDVPESKAAECWSEIVNVLNKYMEQAE